VQVSSVQIDGKNWYGISKCSVKVILVCLSFGSLGILTACSTQTAIEPTPILVQQYSGTSAFDLQYPVEWVSAIIQPGLIVFGPPDVVGFVDTGPSVTIYRIAPENAGLGLEGQLDHFLDFGPYEENFEPEAEIYSSQLGQYSALRVDIARDTFEHLIAMKGYVVSTQVNSGAIYHFVATTTTEHWEAEWPLLASILQSVSFHE
jgi:hypothetical protein